MADHDESCTCALHSSGVGQTLQELEFERGIWQAAKDGEEERVQRLLSQGTDVNARDSAGYTALHYASRSGHASMCRLLISSGAKVNCQTRGGATALHRAAYCGHGEVVRELVRGGGDGGVVDSDGRTPLHKACEGGHLGVARQLLEAFPHTRTTRDRKEQTPQQLVKSWTDQWTTFWEGV